MSAAFRRIAADRLDRAIAATRARSAPERMKAVHDIRKRIKEVRGLLRLVRPDFSSFRDTDHTLRDIARSLSGMRDAKVRLDTYRILKDFVELPAPASADYHAKLSGARDAAYSSDRAEAVLAHVRDALTALQRESADWQLRHAGRKAVFPGLENTYASACAAMARARESHRPEDFHEWRKHVKYHSYHCHILSPIWPEAMAAHGKAASDLGLLLGNHHDLVVLADEARRAGLSDKAINQLTNATAQRVQALEQQAFRDGARLFADTPETLSRRWSVWYRLWATG